MSTVARDCSRFQALVAAACMLLSSNVTAQVTITHEYDSQGRLRSATYSNGYVIEYSYDANGNRISADITARPASLSAPSGLTVTVNSSTRLDVSWQASIPGGEVVITGYKLERCSGATCASFSEIATPTGTSFSNTGLAANATYRYRVRAYDSSLGLYSEYSAIVSGTTPADTTPPNVPANLAASVVSSTQIDLTWNASADAGGSGLSGYRLERCQGVGCTNFAQIVQQSGRTYSNTGLSASTTYRYRVRAYDAAGNTSGYSSIIQSATSADITAPSAPTGLTANATGPTEVSLAWNTSTDAGGSGLVGYKIERCQGAGCTSFAQIAMSTARSYSDSERAPNTAYRYRVRAYDGAGNNSGYSSTANATTPSDTFLPTAPSGLVASATSSTKVNLSWTASTDTGGSGLAGYKIERCTGSGCTSFGQIGTSTTNNYSDTGRSPTTTYVYRVRAYDNAGNHSTFSNSATATTPADTTAPSTPTGLSVTATSSQALSVSWSTSSDSGGSGLVGYKVERCAGASCSNFGQIAAPASASYSNTGLAPATTYRYRVRAYDNAGNHSAYSAIANGTTQPDSTAPTAPTSLSASAASTSQINLSWSASSDSGGSGLSGYKIERCTGSSCTSFSHIGTTASTSYSSTGLVDATSYRYRVRAYDAAGNHSGYSSPAEAKTTDGTAPTSPGIPTVTTIAATSVSVSWAPASDNVGVTAYEYSLDGTSWHSNGASTTKTITGLTSATTYTLRVRARDAASHVSAVSSRTFTTLDNVPPSSPGTPSATNISYTSATLSWGPASDNVGVARYEYRLGTSGNFISTGTNRTASLSGLSVGSTYTIQVRARDAADNVGGVSSSTFTTSLPSITLPSVYSFNVSAPGGATARFYLTSSGDLKRTQSGTTSLLDFGDWISPKIEMSSFEVYAAPQTNTCLGSALGVWHNLGSGVSWYRSVTGTRGATSSCAVTIQIRRVGTTTVLATGVIAAVAVGY